MAKKVKKELEPQIEEHIFDEPLEEVMGTRFGAYAKYVIQDRAIPDIRDGLKPVQRRIIYSMFESGNVYNKPMKKCAHTVGAVMGKYHPHGDSSIYEALARMAQDWKVRVPLIDFQGNKGSIDGDSPAAYRYTEARLSEVASEMVRDLNKETVDMQLTFDDTDFEPVVLPSRFPNLLINGTEGIAVGLATKIPPHNMREVIEAVIYRLSHVRATNEDLMEFVKGPDFPTGGIIYQGDGLSSIYTTGKGKVEVASKVDLVSNKDIQQIIVSEIPYGVNKSTIVYEIDKIRVDKTVDGILEVRDESDRQGLRIVVDLKKDANAEIIINYLLNRTNLRSSFPANMVAIVDNRPKTFTLIDYVDAYINHQVDIITRRGQFDLQKYQGRLHIVDGLIKAISVVDEVVKIIRASKDKADSKINLQNKFKFSEEQSEAIVTMQLYKLSNTDISIFVEEQKTLQNDIKELKEILEDRKKLDKVIINDLKVISQKYGQERRTKIEEKREVVTIDKRDLIAKEEVIVAVTRDGYVKRSSLKSFKASEESLPGIKSGDILVGFSKVMTTDFLLTFTNTGYYCFIPVHEITDNKWKDEGKHLNNIVGLSAEDKIVAAIAVSDFREDLFIVTVSKKGQIKRTALSEFPLQRYSKPSMSIRLMRDDEVASVTFTTGNSDLLILTSEGNATFYNENELTVLGIKASGVKAISSLKHSSYVVSLLAYDPDEKGKVLLLTDRGASRVFDINYLSRTNRLGRIQYVYKCFKSDPHNLVFARKVHKADDVTTLNALLTNKQMLEILVDDYRPTPIDKYAKANIELGANTLIDGVYTTKIDLIDQQTTSYPAPVKVTVKPEKVAQTEGYEQISIFDEYDD